jgi:hypothetical protein
MHAMKIDDSGDALRLLQKHLGHASFNTTAKYRKIAGEEHREWYDHLWITCDVTTLAGNKSSDYQSGSCSQNHLNSYFLAVPQ